MAYRVTMPQMGYDMTEGSINRWLVEEGAKVERGDVIASIATEKADIDIEAYASGVLRRILVQPGSKIPVGQAIAIIAEPEEEIGEPAAELPAAPAAGPTPEPESPPSPAEPEPAETGRPPTTPVPDWAKSINAGARTEVTIAPSPPGQRLKASPLARRRARELGVPLETVSASGPQGRIRVEDVELAWQGRGTAGAAVAAGPAADLGQAVPLTRMREAIARRMAEAKATIPHFYLSTEVDMAALLQLRSELNQLGQPDQPRLSLTDFLIRAVALTLQRHPQLNAAWVEGGMRRFQASNIALAVALPDGLVAPVLRSCEQLGMAELARRAHDLAARAKSNQLRPEELSSGHIAISNLGMFGVSQFAAIITPGQGSALAVGEVREVPVVEGGELRVGRRLTLTLAIDHRVCDGAQGAEALAYLRWLLEHPTACLL
ncbi:MAG: dihydrolipoamide acetyltransferase family protein [Candidatus Dormibacteria bacterium]